MASAFETNGIVAASDIPPSFLQKCVNLTEFTETTTRAFEIRKLNIAWRNRISETRELISAQLLGVSEVLEDYARKLSTELTFKPGLEQKVTAAFDGTRFHLRSAAVLENSAGRLEVLLKFGEGSFFDGSGNYADMRAKEALSIINKITGRKFRKEIVNCNDYDLKFIEEEKFKIASSVAKTVRDDSESSGDTYSYLETDDGEILLSLSDGMGSGRQAKRESAAAIDLLEQFVEAGFKKELALKLINSILAQKGDDDSFSTLDLCAINAYNGNAEFIKIGASSTFLLRDGEVAVIKSSSLPMGVFNDVDTEISVKKLRDNDIIVMVTDGVLENGARGLDKEGWIIDYLGRIKNSNPETLARNLLEEAKSRSDHSIKDDMTILAARIWQANA
jgi:stage II sporulation protein E